METGFFVGELMLVEVGVGMVVVVVRAEMVVVIVVVEVEVVVVVFEVVVVQGVRQGVADDKWKIRFSLSLSSRKHCPQSYGQRKSDKRQGAGTCR